MSEIGGFYGLGQWLRTNMPDVYAMPFDEVRERLNEITGLNAKPGDIMDESADDFLVVLRRMKLDGKLPN